MMSIGRFLIDHMYFIVLLPIIAGVIMFVLPKKLYKPYMLLIQLMVLFMAVMLYVQFRNEDTPQYIIKLGENVISNSYGIFMMLTQLSSMMMLMTVIIFTFCIVYNIHKEYTNKNFLFLFYTLQSLIVGVFLAGDLFNIFVLMEVSTLIVSILIMYKRDSRSMYDGMMYLLTNIVAMTFFLFGVVMLYQRFGTLYIIDRIPGSIDMTSAAELAPNSEIKQLTYLPLAFIFTGISLKAAVMPLFSWLPKAHGTPGAPSVVSAVLSSVYVTVGLYLFMVISGKFAAYVDVSNFFMIAGVITAGLGIIFALTQTDIKLILAYSTVSQLGLILMIYCYTGGDANALSTIGAQYHLLVHGISKAILFLIAGMMVDKYDSRDINDIKGAFKTMPVASIAAFLCMFSLIGMPFFGGWFSKGIMSYSAKNTMFYHVITLANVGTIMIFAKFSSVFFGKNKRELDEDKEPISRYVVFVVGGLLCLLLGVFGDSILQNIFINSSAADYQPKLQVLRFGLLAVSATLIYYFVFDKFKIFKKLAPPDLGFNSVIVSIVIFFVGILGYMVVLG